LHTETETERRIQPPGAAVDVTIVANDIGSVGGMEGVLAELVTGLAELGHSVTVIARSFEVPASPQVVFHRVRGPRRPFLLAYPWFMIAGSLAVRRWRRGVVQATGAIVLNRVDVVHVHYCHQVGPANPSRSTSLFRGYAKIARLVKRRTERARFRANNSATFVCVSEGVAEEVRAHYPELANRVTTIHNGVDTERFAPGAHRPEARSLRVALGIAEEVPVAVFVGSEWERKGLGPVIEAVSLAPEWNLLVAGGGDQRRYQDLADSLGVGQAVHWLGVTSEVQLLYELADAFVLPSSYETFSLVTYEAAASGLPVLGTPVSGVRELIEDGQNGFFISRDPRMIAERLSQLAADPEMRARLARAARQSALAFGWEQMVSKHHELYVRLADRARA
jgi:glycosyltransferase involved in cell wall biosynthesis